MRTQPHNKEREGMTDIAVFEKRATEAEKQIAFLTAKLDELANLLDRHRTDRLIIFTRYNDLVHDVADRFFIPSITYKTGTDERRRYLQHFREDKYSAIVSSQVLGSVYTSS